MHGAFAGIVRSALACAGLAVFRSQGVSLPFNIQPWRMERPAVAFLAHWDQLESLLFAAVGNSIAITASIISFLSVQAMFSPHAVSFNPGLPKAPELL